MRGRLNWELPEVSGRRYEDREKIMLLRKGKPFEVEYDGVTRLPNFVHDVRAAQCVFCPYGAKLAVGERAIAWDDRTIFDRMPRERLVDVVAIKEFRSNGRVITLDCAPASDDEVARIAVDSETTIEALLNHRRGQPTYNPRRTPVVVYFQPCNVDVDLLQFVPDLDVCAREPLRHDSAQRWMRFRQWLRGWVWRSI